MARERIGLLGGSFDPVHIGHLWLAVNAAVALELDEVLLIPAGTPPHKRARPLAPGRHRRAMLALAIRGLPRLRIEDAELRRPGPSYTIDTVRQLLRRRPAEYHLILGADMARDLPNWRQAAILRRLVASVGAAPRPGWRLPRGVRPIPAPPLDVSGRMIRDRVRRGLPITFLVPASVERYILRHYLYR